MLQDIYICTWNLNVPEYTYKHTPSLSRAHRHAQTPRPTSFPTYVSMCIYPSVHVCVYINISISAWLWSHQKRHLYVRKNNVCSYKRAIHIQQRSPISLQKRPIHLQKYVCMHTPLCASLITSKEPCITAKDSYISTKEPYTPQKSPIHAQKSTTYIHS